MTKRRGLFSLLILLITFGLLPTAALAQSSVVISTIAPTIPITETIAVPTPTLSSSPSDSADSLPDSNSLSPAPTNSNSATQVEIITHTVVAGDTLYGIAEQYSTTAETIATINDLPFDGTLREGQQLIVSGILPPPDNWKLIENDTILNLNNLPPVPKVHRVVAGENIGTVAALYDVPTDTIRTANRFAADHQPELNDLIIVPGVEGALIGMTHRVAPGETVDSIAFQYNTAADYLLQDEVVNPHDLPIGRDLPIISRTGWNVPVVRFGYEHVVTMGDTPTTIAATHNIPLSELLRNNPIDPAVPLAPSTRLFIPDSNSPAYEPTAADLATIRLNDNSPDQGSVVSIYIEPLRPISPTGRIQYTDYAPRPQLWQYDSVDQTFPLELYENGFIGFFGLDAFAPPGLYTLELFDEADSTVLFRQNMIVEATNFRLQSIPISDSVDIRAAEDLIFSTVYNTYTPDPLFPIRDVFKAPVDVPYVSAGYGAPRSYAGQPVRIFHSGVDYAAPENTPVSAVAAGIVLFSDFTQLRGNVVIVDHGWGVMSSYVHLARRLVSFGDPVDASEVIGSLGNTGLSTGPHLHWEMRVHGVSVNGLQWLELPIFPN